MRFAWIDERPFNYLDERDELVGCDVALARAACHRIGVEFEPVHTTFAQLLPGLSHGLWDFTTGMFITPERQRVAAFTRPIWSLQDGILVSSSLGAVTSGYRSMSSKGKRLAVLRDQVQWANAQAHGFRSHDLVIYETYPLAVEALRAGTVDGYASVSLAHREYLAVHPDLELTVTTVPADEVAPSLGAFACSSPGLAHDLDLALNQLLGTQPPQEPSPDPADWPTH